MTPSWHGLCAGTRCTPEQSAGYRKLWAEGRGPGQHGAVTPTAPPTFDCIHRGPVVETKLCDLCGGPKGLPFEVHACAKHGQCSIHKKHTKVKSCVGCKEIQRSKGTIVPESTTLTLPIGRPPGPRGTIVPFRHAGACAVFDRFGRSMDGLEGLYAGAACFLLNGGPSLADVDLRLLRQPGITLAAVNNAGTVIRPHLAFSMDPIGRFSETIHRDPSVLKFVQRARSRESLRTFRDGKHVETGEPIREVTNSLFYNHSNGLLPGDFLTRLKPTVGADGQRSVLYVSLRLLYWLGFRRIFLVGCDFHMTPERPYGFDETKTEKACGNINKKFKRINATLTGMRPHFEAAGLKVINCTPGGRLTAFDRLSLEDAVGLTRRDFPEQVVTRGSYAS